MAALVAVCGFLQEHPELLADVMKAMEMRLDHARVVHMFRKEGHLPLIKDYLLNVQKTNILEVRGVLQGLAGSWRDTLPGRWLSAGTLCSCGLRGLFCPTAHIHSGSFRLTAGRSMMVFIRCCVVECCRSCCCR